MNAISAPKLDTWAIPSYHVAHDMLHMKSVRCAARDLRTIAPCGHFSVRVGDSSRRSKKIYEKSRFTLFSDFYYFL